MKLSTKNFLLSALANQYAAAVYDLVKQQSGGDFFTLDTGKGSIKVEIMGGVLARRDRFYFDDIHPD